MTSAEEGALLRFAYENGRRWKQALRDEWMRACSGIPMETTSNLEYRGALQRLRNDPDFGPRGLAAYRLTARFKFKPKR